MAVPGPGQEQKRPRATPPSAPTDPESGNQPGSKAGASTRPAPQPAPSPTGGRVRGPWSHNAFVTGFLLATGALVAYWLGTVILRASSVIVLIIVSLFIAFGLNPVVRWLVNRGIRRSLAVLLVAIGFLLALGLFALAIAPVIADQVAAITDNAPAWFDRLSNSRTIQRWDQKYDLISKAQDYVTSGKITQTLFGGVLGVGLAILGALANAFIVIVLTLYFLASLDHVRHTIYRLAPASRRERVSDLGDRILEGIGGYVSGAFVIAMCAGISTLVFLFIVGLGEYAVALAVVVALLDVIPMIGATLGAIVVSAIGLATDVQIGIACIIFYVIYQQLENYVLYPRVMARSVDIPGAVTVIAALVGASLLGVIGALLAIPTAAAILLLVRELYISKQDHL
ncbi:MAG TPA: AI-2E family transporter [Marmoricola sp.]|nr:AI-2E family transporter [Marmoricola sp.]